MSAPKTKPPPGSVTTDAIPDGDLFKADILSARGTASEQRVMDGLRLYEMAAEISRAGLRNRNPDAGEAEIDCLFLALEERHRRMVEHGIYSYRPMTPEEAGL
ncbi:MAG: hypothetical protein AAF907_16365 [Planctomycetota bacterium]